MSKSGERWGSATRRFSFVENLDDIRWRAVQLRDASAADIFIYGVSSTGVFCRPGCASRTPLRRNVEFFFSPDDALSAGYHACQRCRPDLEHAVDPSLAAVISLCRRLEKGDLDLGSFAASVGYSEGHLRRRFSQVVGVPVATYARAQRAISMRHALKSNVPVTRAAYESGYGSSRAFYEHGALRLGMSPRAYQGGASGERITYTTLSTPIGIVVAACTDRGLCAVRIGEDEETLVVELANEFPKALLERDDEGLFEVARVLAAAVRGEGGATSLPVDIEGTAFQMRVWEALRAVPTGSTLTYSQLAQRIGAPRAVRAVGSACAANPVALAVPCHRVVRRDGTLGGYRWGLAVKESLLKVEGGR